MKSEPWDICEVFSIPPTVLGILWLSFLLGPNGLIHIHLVFETRVTILAAWTNLHSGFFPYPVRCVGLQLESCRVFWEMNLLESPKKGEMH